MKQKIGCVNKPGKKINDIDIAFVAFYNLIHEKLETEPNKGIVVTIGEEKRKVKWSEVMNIAHCMEDYFTTRSEKCRGTCSECVQWESVSEQSPHLGVCDLKPNKYTHKFGYCKKFERKDIFDD